MNLLDSPSRFIESNFPAYDHLHSTEMQLNVLPIPESGYVAASNAGNGFVSSGFRFDSRFLFDVTQLRLMLQDIDVERFKGIFRTNDGGKVLNLASGVLTELSVSYCEESRCEAIGRELPDDLTDQLLSAVTASKLL